MNVVWFSLMMIVDQENKKLCLGLGIKVLEIFNLFDEMYFECELFDFSWVVFISCLWDMFLGVWYLSFCCYNLVIR